MEGKSHLIQNDQTIFSGSQQERTPQNYPDQAVSNESCTVTTEAMDTAGVSEMQAFRSDTVLTGGKAHIFSSKSSNFTQQNVNRLTGLAAIAYSYKEDDETSAESSTELGNFKKSSTGVECWKEELDNKTVVENSTNTMRCTDASIKNLEDHKVVENNNNVNACEKVIVCAPKNDASLKKQESEFSSGSIIEVTSQIKTLERESNEIAPENHEIAHSEPFNIGTAMAGDSSESVQETEVVGHPVVESNNIGNKVKELVSTENVVSELVNTGKCTTMAANTSESVHETEVVGHSVVESNNIDNIVKELGSTENVMTELVNTGTAMAANTSESVQEDNGVEHSVRQLNNIGNVLKEPVGIGNIGTEPVNTTSTYREPVKVGYTITDCGNIANKVTEPVHMGDTTNEHHNVVGLANKPANTKHILPEHLNIGAESNTENMTTVQAHIEDITKEPLSTGITSGGPVNVENVKLETDNAFLNTASSKGSVDQVYAMDTIDHELDRIRDKGTGDQIQDTTETDSSSSDSSSDSDDESSSSESSTSSDDDLEDIRREIEKEEEQVLKGPPRTKSEVLAKDLPEIPELDITIDDDVQLVELGVIFSIVGSMVVVKALPQTPALDSDSILFMGNRSCLGLVFETFGPVQTPFYSVRFNRESDICSKNVHVGDKVFYAPDVMEYSHYVFVAQLKKLKGSDASWEHDEEPPPEAVEYSDDEEESKARASRRKERMAKSGSIKTDETTRTTGESGSHFHQGFKRDNRKRTWQNHAKGKTVTQNQNQGMPPSNSVPMPHPAYRGPTPWSGSASPLQASERPYMGPPPHEALHFQGLSEGPPRGVLPVMLPPIGPPSSVPMGHIPLTEPGPMINVPRPPFGPPRPFGGGPGVQNPWPGSPSPGFSHRYPIPAPQHFQNPRGNIQSFPGREFMAFGVPPPPPPPTPPPM